MREKAVYFLIYFFLIGLICSTAQAEEALEDTGVKRYGVVHNIAEDRHIEKIGGAYEPEGIDKYNRRHFDRIHDEIADIKLAINENQEILIRILQQMDQIKMTENQTSPSSEEEKNILVF